MSLSRIRSRSSSLAAVLAVGLALLSVGHVAAQPRPTIPLDARGYQTTLAMQEYYQHRQAAPSHAVIPGAATPRAEEPRYVRVVGPDGQVRTFQIEGPVTVVPPQAHVFHWGAR